MSKLPNPKQIVSSLILEATKPSRDREKEVLKILEEYGRQVRDTTLEWAAENAKLGVYSRSGGTDTPDEDYFLHTIEECLIDDSGWQKDIVKVHKDSILSGKISKELEI